jgi:multiple sugar transport system permease protein
LQITSDLATVAVNRREKRRAALSKCLRLVISHAILIVGALTMVIPFLWMISTSLKSSAGVFQYPPQWIPNPIKWDNYRELMTIIPFARYFTNTAFVAGIVTLLQLLTCSMAAYSFARLRFPGRDALFILYLSTLMIPMQVRIIPNFILMRYMGWLDTYRALIIPAAFSSFGTFLLRQFFMTLPTELEDAAKIDGCSYLRIFLSMILPLSKPALATLAIYTFMGQWNDFLWPLVVISREEMRTLTVGLRAMQGLYYTNWPILMAGSVMSVLPILVVFFVAQKQFVQGITLTGMKG